MKITICDDEEEQLALIVGYTKEYVEHRKFDIEINKFKTPDELLEYESRNRGSEIYLLDIVMDGMNGLELGVRLRKNNKRAFIIYITTAKEFSLEAFSVNAFSYLIKPFKKEKLFSELDKCFDYYQTVRKKKLIITAKTVDGIMPMNVTEINAVEYFDHRLRYHMTDKKMIEGIYQKAPFDKQAKEIIDTEMFVKSANSYLVNMENVLSVASQEFKMKNGLTFPITRKYSDAKIKFLNAKLKNH